ncbi:MAG: HU family DNA-binding protein [Devosia sp.]|uniref:HU family DNA-binding protein n=1 Tax=Devosia sp. TaxID=1871048 RepID=UPI0024CCEA22|nr:HU family DNA-binding protein [Devosia sp.]UYN99077.1 MAG: HU family DNA-binding protein [Devosia sp.]
MVKTVTRAVLGEAACAASELSRSDVNTLCEQMLELIGDRLAAGETVKLTGFGTLEVRSRAERVGRNPRTGTEHAIAPHRTVVFIPSAKLKTQLQAAKP